MDDSILQISIMERVKKVIDINTDIDEYQLYKLLHETMISCHPDKFTDENIKNQAEEKFKQLQNLKAEFDEYLEQQRSNRQVAISHSQDEEKLALIKTNSDKDLEIIILKSKIKELCVKIDNLDNEVDSCKKQLKDCQDNYDKRISEEVNYSKESISSLYKPKTLGNVIGTTASVASLSLFLPQVKNILNDVGISILYGSLIFVSVIWLITHFRRYVAIKLSDNIVSKIFSDTNINKLFNIKNNYRKTYFAEKGVYHIVSYPMSKKWVKLFFFDNYDILKKDIVDRIILELEAKKLINGHLNNGLEKEFIVERIEHC